MYHPPAFPAPAPPPDRPSPVAAAPPEPGPPTGELPSKDVLADLAPSMAQVLKALGVPNG